MILGYLFWVMLDCVSTYNYISFTTVETGLRYRQLVVMAVFFDGIDSLLLSVIQQMKAVLRSTFEDNTM